MKIAALAGGVGGAKLVDGLAAVLPPEALTVIVNTGDDFEHLGLRICPDLDTVLYTLAGLADPRRGWGRADESWHFLEEMERIGGPTWFRLGDRDLALHIERTRRLKEGESLSEVMSSLRRALGIRVSILPMTDHQVETLVHLKDGKLSFQEYFVARRAEPAVRGFHFRGVERAEPAPGVLQAIDQAGLVILCPSNPWVSLDPILAIRGIRQALRGKSVIGISPILGSKTVKGPAAKMYSEMGIEPSAFAVAQHYMDILRGFMIDTQDAGLTPQIEALGIEVCQTDILMADRADRQRLAGEVLQFAREHLQAEGIK